ncbi:hypothetical protein ACLQ3C_10310 [Gordonia sp. DT30]|uniref:hypothetical protein n=1 Tax=unclassified Gordonia (in: high G+C Gram-positive bacteria) TaxID=2657482 RepID=UPI003CF89A3D
MAVWEIVLIVVAVWVALSVVLALLIGAIIRQRDRREAPREPVPAVDRTRRSSD